MSFIEQIKERAKTEIKTIVLPEATDQRILEAAQIVKNDGYAKVILIGNEDEVKKIANDKKIDIEGIKIVDPSKSEKKEKYANKLYELRKAKGMTEEHAQKLI